VNDVMVVKLKIARIVGFLIRCTHPLPRER